MIQSVLIENYKSIKKLKIDLSGVNVFIGANGSGKSNILEGIGIGAAAASDKMDNEFLANRGIRISDIRLMRNAFDKEDVSKPIKISFKKNNVINSYDISNSNDEYAKWGVSSSLNEKRQKEFSELFKTLPLNTPRAITNFLKNFEEKNKIGELKDFIIYSPENNELRKFDNEAMVSPLGVHGEGLFKLLKNMDEERLNKLKSSLKMIDWFEDFHISENSGLNERKIQLKDRYIDDDISYFDQRNSNEGFLFLLFYLSLFISKHTPKFFAIDNIDNALNPKLCKDIIQKFNILSKEYDKQVIVTTHNPAVLDGIDLTDKNFNLFVVFRNLSGITKVKKIDTKSFNYDSDVRLSEAFNRGLIGGLNKNTIKW